jgi:hypothetical protein
VLGVEKEMNKTLQYILAILLNLAALSYLGLTYEPLFVQTVVAVMILLAAFMVIVPLYEGVQRNIKNHPWMQKAFYVPLTIFLAIDVTVNINYSLLLLLGHPAGKLGEDLTFTDHCKAIKVYTENKIFLKQHLTKLEEIRYKLCNFYGGIMDTVQKGHYQ